MERAWPFEGSPEHGPIRTPQDFIQHRGAGTEAVVIRIGLNDAQLVLVDRAGDWQRWVLHSMEEAGAAAEKLGVPVHMGEYPEEMRVRINSHRRGAADYDRSAYPEQGGVGPVMSYPENRPRQKETLAREGSGPHPGDQQGRPPPGAGGES